MEEAPAFVKWLVDKYDDLEFFMVRSFIWVGVGPRPCKDDGRQ